MNKSILLLLLTFFYFGNSFVNFNNYNNINNKINPKPQLNKEEIPIKLIIMKENPLESYNFLDNLLDLNLEPNKKLGQIIVEDISSLLPKVDSIGHKVLHANNELISYILNLNEIPHFLKKDLILLSIKLAQAGDNLGSDMLQLYYDIVDKCL